MKLLRQRAVTKTGYAPPGTGIIRMNSVRNNPNLSPSVKNNQMTWICMNFANVTINSGYYIYLYS